MRCGRPRAPSPRPSRSCWPTSSGSCRPAGPPRSAVTRSAPTGGSPARDSPDLDAPLHSRRVAVSSVREPARRWFPRVYFAQPAKGLAHRALADIIESVRELAYYRRTLFVPAPGPNSDQAKGPAEEAIGSFAEVLAAGDATPRVGVDDVTTPAASE